MLSFKKGEVFIFSFFILLTLVITYPLVFNLDNSIFGDEEWLFDSLGSLYGTWWLKYAMQNKFPINVNHLLAYPFGLDTSKLPPQPGIILPSLILVLIGNEFLAYNLRIIGSFILSAIIVYYLVFYLTKNKLASMVAGIIFSFCPNHSLQAFSHLGLAIVQWMPLYILTLLMLLEWMNYKRAFLCALAFALVVLTNYYYGYFMIIFTIGFIIFILIYLLFAKDFILKKYSIKKVINIITATSIFILIMLSPFIYPTVKTALTTEKSGDISMVYERSYDDVFKYSARFYDYLLPSEYHPVFGSFTKNVIKRITGGQRHWAERTLYLGIAPIFLAIIAVVKWGRRKSKRVEIRKKFYIPFFLFSAVFAYYSSLAPLISFWKIKIPTPSFFLYYIAPMFRVYSRLGIVVTLCIAVLAGFGIREILTRIRSKWKQIGITLAFSSIIIFEYTVIPPLRNVDFSKIPLIYTWLAEQPKDIVIAEYPVVRSIEERHFKYQFYQRIHKKKMINGAEVGTLADAIRIRIEDIIDLSVPSILSYLGARYVIVHKDVYDIKQMNAIDNVPGMIFIRDFPTVRVYKVVAQPPKLIQVPINFGKVEVWDDGSKWQWIDNNAQLWFCNNYEKEIFIELRFMAISFAQDRTLEIFLNDILLRKIMISSVPSSKFAKQITIEKISLSPGNSTIKFCASEGPQRIDDILHNGDMRKVSIAFSSIQVEPHS